MPKSYRRKRATRRKTAKRTYRRRPTRVGQRGIRALTSKNGVLASKVRTNMDFWYPGGHMSGGATAFNRVTFLSDPYNPGGVFTGKQPALFDNYMALWTRGRVLKCTVECTVTNYTVNDPIMIMLMGYPSTSDGSIPIDPNANDWKAISTDARSGIKVLNPYGVAGSTKVLRKTFYPAKQIDNYFDTVRSQFSASAVATEFLRISLCATNVNTVSIVVPDLIYNFRMRFECELSSPVLAEMAALD